MNPATSFAKLHERIQEFNRALEVASEVTQGGHTWVLRKGQENILFEIQKIIPESLKLNEELRSSMDTLRQRVQRLEDDTPAKQAALERLNSHLPRRVEEMLEEIEKGLLPDCFDPFERDGKWIKPGELEKFRALLNSHPLKLELTDTAETPLTAQDYIQAAKRVVNCDFVTAFSAFLPSGLQSEDQAEEARAFMKSLPEIAEPAPMIFDSEQMRTIPSEISILNQLDDVEFRGQFHIPQALLMMKSLIRIAVAKWVSHALLEWIYTMPTLKYLQIGNLKFDLNRLRHLKNLTLANVDSEDLPASIGNLNALEGLAIFENQFQRLPREIGRLTALTHLCIINNPNLALLPAELGKLINLVELTLYGSFETLPDEIGDLSRLKFLRLKSDKLLQLPNSLGNIQALERLECHPDNLHLLPGTLVHLQQIVNDKGVVLWSAQSNILLADFLSAARKHPQKQP